MPDAILTDVADGVAVITINRPRGAQRRQRRRRSRHRRRDRRVRRQGRRAALSCSPGPGGTFSAGMDLKGFLSGDAPIAAGRGFGGIAERPPAKPVIAAVEGYALAGGFELVLACDLVVASEEAKFGLPEVRRGLVAGAGGLLRLPSRIPYHVAMEIALTGEHFPAAGWRRSGWSISWSRRGRRCAAAKELAARVALGAPLALAASKRVIVESADWPASEAFARQAEIIRPIFGSKDAMEGAIGVRREAAAGLARRVAPPDLRAGRVTPEASRGNTGDWQLISVVVPFYNNADHARRLPGLDRGADHSPSRGDHGRRRLHRRQRRRRRVAGRGRSEVPAGQRPQRRPRLRHATTASPQRPASSSRSWTPMTCCRPTPTRPCLPCSSATGSDFVCGGGAAAVRAPGSASPGCTTRAIKARRLRTHISRTPELFYDISVWNKLFRRSFWDASRAHLPRGHALGRPGRDDARRTCWPRSVDVITEPVYHWRDRDKGAPSITQSRTGSATSATGSRRCP